jgi:hypothetical protein
MLLTPLSPDSEYPKKARTGPSPLSGAFLRRALYLVVQSAGLTTRCTVLAAEGSDKASFAPTRRSAFLPVTAVNGKSRIMPVKAPGNFEWFI